MKNLLKKIISTSLLVFGLGAGYFACSANLKTLNDNDSGQEGSLNLNIQNDAENEYCVESTAAKILSSRPVDIIFVIDNSGSMTEEIDAIVNNINDHFTDVMTAAGLDYRVIMLVKHGTPGNWKTEACFEEPLSTIPKGGCANIGGSPPGNNPGKFYHYSYDVQSNDSPCVILDTLFSKNNRQDTFDLAPDGWIKWLRKSAFKVFIEVTDDAPNCWWYPDIDDEEKKIKKVFSDFQSELGGHVFSLEFDKQLTKIAPEQFGTSGDRNYVFYSIVGMMEKPEAFDEAYIEIDPNGKSDDPFLPSEGIVSNVCKTAVAAGQGYQALSKLTGGLRFPICQAEKFDVVFDRIAKSIDSITSTICILELPKNVEIDIATVVVEVELDSGVLKLNQVEGSANCSNNFDEFYIDKTSNAVVLCDTACLQIKSISKNVKLTAGCIEPLF